MPLLKRKYSQGSFIKLGSRDTSFLSVLFEFKSNYVWKKIKNKKKTNNKDLFIFSFAS